MASSFLEIRAAVFDSVRSFFKHRGYLEVDTPCRLPSLIPEAHIDPQTSEDWFLQTSPEICMKRLLARGHEKIFQICRCFRKNERGTLHLPEFTMLEWYRTGIDYLDLMAECEDLLRFLILENGFSSTAAQSLCSASAWQHLSVESAFALYSQTSVKDSLEQDIFEETLVRDIEPHLGIGRPTFLFDYPAELGSLARLKGSDHSLVERFELYVNGVELANGFSELTDAEEQHGRFSRERTLGRKYRRDFGPMPAKFLDDLERIDEAAGIALGLDRLVMLLCGAERIDDVVSFTPESL